MAVSLITYTDKETLNEQPSIADENKVSDDDMNEIKSVVNLNAFKLGDLENLDTTAKTSIVAALNELATPWTLLGTETGNTDISLPNSYREILIIVEAISSSARSWNVGTFPKIYIDGMTENHAFRSGHYDTSSDYSACAVWIKTDKKVSLAGTSYNGTSQTGRIYVYYR